MSSRNAVGVLATLVFLWPLGAATGQVSLQPGEASRDPPEFVLTYQASGGFAGIRDELQVLPDGRAYATRLLPGKEQARWALLAPAEVSALNQAVAALFPVPKDHDPGSGDMLWVIGRQVPSQSHELRTWDPTGYGAPVIQWMGDIHHAILGGKLPPPPERMGEATKGPGHTDLVTGMAGPAVAPMGSTIQIAIANDSAETVTLWCPSPFRITDPVGHVVHWPLSPPVLVGIPPGEVHRMSWRQTDDLGEQVPEGDYVVEFLNLDLDPVTICIDSTVETGLTMVGPLRPGTERTLFLTSPGDQNRIYIASASVSADVGTPTCMGLFPLDQSWLLDFSIRPNNGVFLDFIGDLDERGETLAPSIRLPDSPSLTGITWYLAFVTVEFGGFCPLQRISTQLEVTIL